MFFFSQTKNLWFYEREDKEWKAMQTGSFSTSSKLLDVNNGVTALCFHIVELCLTKLVSVQKRLWPYFKMRLMLTNV